MLDGDGVCAWSGSIDVYGALRNVDGDRGACPFRWLGQFEDLETELNYNRYRYYDPESGRYLSSDPIGLAGGANLYGYVRDPLASTDPFGLTDSRETCRGNLGPDTLVNRIGGAHVENLRLKPQEQALSPPGISVLLATSAKDAAQQMKNAFPKATGLHEQARTVGGSSIAKVRRAGFDVLPDPTKRFPNHGRLVHPDGTSGFNDENLQKLSNEFTNMEGLK
jgi:RHS repeat-associated protein